MMKPRLGVAIIIDNMCTPKYEVHIAALQEAYHTAGFEVHVYSNCDIKVRYNLLEQHLISHIFPLGTNSP